MAKNQFTEDDFKELHVLIDRLVTLLFAYYRYLSEINSSFAMRDLVRGLAISVRSLGRYVSLLINHG